MPDARRRGALRIGLCHDGLALLQDSGWPRRQRVLLGTQAIDPTPAPDFADAAGDALSALLRATSAGSLPASLVLADELVRLWMVVPPANASSPADLRAAGQARFEALYGEDVTGWQLAADWQAGQPFLACAWPQPLAAALVAAAASRQVTLVQIQPQFVAAWNGARRLLGAGGWLGVAQAGMLTLGAVAGGRLQAVRRLRLAPEALGGQALRQQVTQEALRLALPPPTALHLAGQIDPAWLTTSAAPSTAPTARAADWPCHRLGPALDAGQPAALGVATTG